MYPVKFELKYEPTNLKQIARWPYWFGIILLVLTFFGISIGQVLPLELYTLYLFKLAADFLFHMLTLGIIFISVGYILDKLSWRNGKVTFNDNAIEISGEKSVNIPYDTINCILSIKTSFRILQIDTTHYNVKFKFQNIRDFKVIHTLLNKRIAN